MGAQNAQRATHLLRNAIAGENDGPVAEFLPGVFATDKHLHTTDFLVVISAQHQVVKVLAFFNEFERHTGLVGGVDRFIRAQHVGEPIHEQLAIRVVFAEAHLVGNRIENGVRKRFVDEPELFDFIKRGIFTAVVDFFGPGLKAGFGYRCCQAKLFADEFLHRLKPGPSKPASL